MASFSLSSAGSSFFSLSSSSLSSPIEIYKGFLAAAGGSLAGYTSGFSSSDSSSVRTPGSGSSSSEPSSLLSKPHSTRAYSTIGDLHMYSCEIFGNLKIKKRNTYL